MAKDTVDDKIWWVLCFNWQCAREIVQNKLDVVGQTLNGSEKGMEELIPANTNYASILENIFNNEENEPPKPKQKRKRSSKQEKTIEVDDKEAEEPKQQDKKQKISNPKTPNQKKLTFEKIEKAPSISSPNKLTTEECVAKFFQILNSPKSPSAPIKQKEVSTKEEVIILSDSDDDFI